MTCSGIALAMSRVGIGIGLMLLVDVLARNRIVMSTGSDISRTLGVRCHVMIVRRRTSHIRMDTQRGLLYRNGRASSEGGANTSVQRWKMNHRLMHDTSSQTQEGRNTALYTHGLLYCNAGSKRSMDGWIRRAISLGLYSNRFHVWHCRRVQWSLFYCPDSKSTR